ncbi:hypothetical protein [Dokdonella sp.]|uniref:hypothetical protein n=1 Tax=Dokdonella sp. TaxID=2291710 RepID=UPI001B06F432|nr:hypothetical protein [Dokdonella sp.]MBO9664067.1 hypothetical protein [Dokdonella sp.]
MSTNDLTPNDLLPGDVLLHMGAGELSKLIAWVGDSLYSHAALVVDKGQLIEAAASGVRRAGLAERARMTKAFHYIDVFRPAQPAPDNHSGLAALLAASDAYLGRPYPMTSLFQLGVTCAVRNKLTDDPALRIALRMALDLVVKNDTDKVVCSELVYRGFDEARTTPAHALRLQISTRAVPHQPVPKIDVDALANECLEDYRHSLPAHSLQADANGAKASARDLDDLLGAARSRLGIGQASLQAAADYAPNPKTVLPADLEFSPGLRRMGRLAMAA